jgi:hypothetical protein
MQFVYNIFQCNISTSTEALLGLSNDDHIIDDVFGDYKQMFIGCKFDYWIRDGQIIWEFVEDLNNQSTVILLMCSYWFQFTSKLEVGWHSSRYKSIWSALLNGGGGSVYPWAVSEASSEVCVIYFIHAKHRSKWQNICFDNSLTVKLFLCVELIKLIRM